MAAQAWVRYLMLVDEEAVEVEVVAVQAAVVPVVVCQAAQEGADQVAVEASDEAQEAAVAVVARVLQVVDAEALMGAVEEVLVVAWVVQEAVDAEAPRVTGKEVWTALAVAAVDLVARVAAEVEAEAVAQHSHSWD